MIAREDIDALCRMLPADDGPAVETLQRVADRCQTGTTQHREVTAEEFPLFLRGALIGWALAAEMMRAQRVASEGAMGVFDKHGRGK